VSNKFSFPIGTFTSSTINIPIEFKWDLYGRSDSIDKYEQEVTKDIVGTPTDFEISRYSHKPYSSNGFTSVNYKFYFYNGVPTLVSTSTPSDWVNSYLAEGFNSEEIYYYRKPFTNSFFKLDFYDTNNTTTQTNYITVILPVQQGLTETKTISPLMPPVKIKKPNMILDFVGDKEGFFFYWLRNPSFLNIDTFYMSVKFFDARLGVFVRLMTKRQCDLPNVYNFNNEDLFFRKVVFDFTDRTYQIFDDLNVRIGTGTPIEWYEYVNPPA
jgi:hypothetical protein